MLNPLIGILELIIHLDLHIVKNKIKYHLKIYLKNFDLMILNTEVYKK